MKCFSAFLFATTSALSICRVAGEGGFEWAGTFALNDASHQWSMQSVDGEYADPSMRLVIVPVPTASQEAIEANEAKGESMITSSDCQKVEAGGSIGPVAEGGACYELHVGSQPDSLFPMVTEGLTGIVVFAQHFPIEFERDMHYLKDSAGTDIEPVAQEGGDGHHHHDHGHSEGGGKSSGEACACVAKEYNFKIDCTATAAMSDAFDFLKTGGCATDCTTDACQEAWYIVQAHHDYCQVDQLPSTIEDGFHDFDETCLSCDISRAFQEGVPSCPIANCEDQSGNEAYAFLVENGCLSDCSSEKCTNAYLTLRVVHDDCEHDVISTASEEGLHDFEDVCKVGCNAPASKGDQLTCSAITDDASAKPSGAVASSATGAALLGAAALLMA